MADSDGPAPATSQARGFWQRLIARKRPGPDHIPDPSPEQVEFLKKLDADDHMLLSSRLSPEVPAPVVTPERLERVKKVESMEWYLARKRAVMGGRVKPTSLPLHRFYRFAATALGASMWFFIFYRAKQDGPVILGWKHPWDH